MRTLFRSSALLTAALIVGPQALAQTPSSLPGGGEFLPPPGASSAPSTDGATRSTKLPPAGGGEFLPPSTR